MLECVNIPPQEALEVMESGPAEAWCASCVRWQEHQALWCLAQRRNASTLTCHRISPKKGLRSLWKASVNEKKGMGVGEVFFCNNNETSFQHSRSLGGFRSVGRDTPGKGILWTLSKKKYWTVHLGSEVDCCIQIEPKLLLSPHLAEKKNCLWLAILDKIEVLQGFQAWLIASQSCTVEQCIDRNIYLFYAWGGKKAFCEHNGRLNFVAPVIANDIVRVQNRITDSVSIKWT